MGRRTLTREESAARLRALTRRAYTASSGHLDLEDDAGREFDRIVHGPDPAPGPPARRWAVSLRAALVVLAVLAALTGVVVLRSLAAGSAPLPVAHEHSPAHVDDATHPDSGTDPDGGTAPTGTTVLPGVGQRPAESQPTAATPEAGPRAGVTVHVAGGVVTPGVYELSAGARVAGAVEAAGGATADAELAAINLARPLQDGEQVYVPRVGEAPPGSQAGGPGSAQGPGGPGDAGNTEPAVVDLNTADAAGLETLPGVGPAIAQRILDWRAANGPFHSVEELLEVSGIGPATLERLRDRVRV